MNKEKIIAEFAQRFADTKKEYTAIATIKGEVDRLASKFGGAPYWPADMPYPTTKTGEQLYLLAQFHLDEIATLPKDFPTTGMLQFFIASDDVYGCEFSESLEQDGYRVVYHATLSEDLLADVPTNAQTPEYEFPFVETYRLAFLTANELLSLSDYRMVDAEDLAKDEADEDEVMDVLFDNANSAGHKLGGYPYFTQWDPREGSELLQGYELLFQLDSEMDDAKDIMWGDVGVANFFIHPDDLKRRDFSKVAYNWDCH